MEVNVRQRKGNGHAYEYPLRVCDICPMEFRPKSPQHKHCSRRCAYIAVKLGRAAASGMSREVAIEFYGSQYDDPLRHVKRGRTKQLIRHVMNFCEKNDTIFVTRGEVEEYSGLSLTPNAFEMAAREVPALTYFATRLVEGGRRADVWQFLVEDLVSNAEARANNARGRAER